MGEKGTRAAVVWERERYKLVATSDCYLFSFREQPVFSQTPIPLQDGTLLHPRDVIIEARGKHTSAGFHHIIMNDGYAIRYVGSTSGEKEESGSRMLCFEQLKNGEPLPMDYPPGHKTYIGYLEVYDHSWLFCTPAIASRIIETSMVKRLPGGDQCLVCQ